MPYSPCYGLISWTCGDCLEPHIWDILNGAARVISNQRIPGMKSRVRPDLTVLDSQDRPLAIVEFRKSHLSSLVEKLASERDIPLFVVDITESPEDFQMGINNRRRSTLRRLTAYMSPNDEDMMRATERTMDLLSASVAEEGGVSASITHITDNAGNLCGVELIADGKTDALPEPSVGGILMAHRSSLSCDSQKQWIVDPWGL